MSSTAKVQVVVLWDHELRVAAKSLSHLRTLLTEAAKEKADCPDLHDVVWQTIVACAAALAGVEDDGMAITISSLPKPAGRRERA